MSNSTSVTSDDLGIQSINLGNGLVPFAALTTLIGSDIAETLALGERGPAGLVWSIASVFGAPSVIKAFISGASPGWLRSLLGLRSIASDRAVGLDLKLARKSSQAIKKVQSEPLSRDHPSCKDVYAFDRSTMRIVEGLKKTLPRDPLTVYVAIPNPLLRVRTTIIQSPALALSLLKCLELYCYWTNGAHHLAVILAIPFAFFFVSGEFLAWRLGDIGNLDVIIGDLPTWKKAGGEKKVVLGLLAEPRTSIWWRLMWSIGGLLHIVSLAFTYFVLTKMTVVFTLMWAGFQVAWVACRILTYHFTGSMREPMADRMMVGHRWQDLDVMMKTRVLNLTLAAAHEPQKPQMSCELPRHFDPSKSSSIEIEITAMIGDSVLSSALWMVGSDKSPMDMYDSCVVFLSFPPSLPSPSSPSLGPPLAPSTFAIPAARVGRSMGDVNTPDTEKSTPVFAPRGTCARCSEYTHTWWYWIPCGPNRWLQIQSKNLMAVSGRCTAEVLDDGQLSALLGAGT
ncbi:hypothetical protein B0F90DRAFT_1669651 [Multifurca ochricompacta]|uniref:Uncharacterized protein n=1 Tax=Multifurca ochricompacta TaxID=376703 RepID=A0AAD4LZM1_9AGAM|nr:hypothetical protein B0F90DRAFT_1669651 [Multifurca ochricompacta]